MLAVVQLEAEKRCWGLLHWRGVQVECPLPSRPGEMLPVPPAFTRRKIGSQDLRQGGCEGLAPSGVPRTVKWRRFFLFRTQRSREHCHLLFDHLLQKSPIFFLGLNHSILRTQRAQSFPYPHPTGSDVSHTREAGRGKEERHWKQAEKGNTERRESPVENASWAKAPSESTSSPDCFPEG